jgi:hypothetical protein
MLEPMRLIPKGAVVLILLLFLGKLIALAEPPDGYYATAEGKAGAELRQTLHSIIRNHHGQRRR